MLKLFQNQDEVQSFASENSLTVVTYKGNVYDLTDFLDYHPGGHEIILQYENSDISDVFHDEQEHEHSKAALNMMKDYIIGKISKEGEKGKYEKNEGSIMQFSNFSIDMSKGLTSQVFSLKLSQYKEMINNPISLKDVKIFDSFLEMFSRTKWWIIPLVHIPFSLFLLYCGIFLQYEPSVLNNMVSKQSEDFKEMVVAFTFIFGMLFWTLTEYSLHKYVFHSEDIIPDNGVFLVLHFLIHGIHHFAPQDPARLVFPPALFAILWQPTKFLFLCVLPLNYCNVFLSGMVIGYICYDLIHYYIHHGKFKKGKFLEMKRYHGLHHYSDHNGGFGISSNFWDIVFHTLPQKYNSAIKY